MYYAVLTFTVNGTYMARLAIEHYVDGAAEIVFNSAWCALNRKTLPPTQ